MASYTSGDTRLVDGGAFANFQSDSFKPSLVMTGLGVREAALRSKDHYFADRRGGAV